MGIYSVVSREWLFVHCFEIKLKVKNILVFVKGGKPKDPHGIDLRIQTRATMVGDEHSHHPATPVLLEFELPN